MKLYLILIAILSAFMILFPLATVNLSQNTNETTSAYTQTETTQNITQTEETVQTKDSDISTIKVLRASSGKVIDLEIYDYLIGAVAGEMPASYEKEAIKAQAVACYTYAKWIKLNSDRSELSGADISDSSSKHQGYLDESALRKKWGDKYDSNIAKIKECVNEVMGEYMVYDNEPIVAVYHAISPGRTLSAASGWKKDIPYLKSVVANGDKLSPDFDSTVTMSEAEFKKCAQKLDGASLSGDAKDWVKSLKKDETGFVTSVKIGSKTFDGNDIRSAFALKSPFFTLTYKNKKFTFKVKGYGHGIGMSQYSADYMARQGSTYKEILLHFYTGVKLVKD